MKMCILLFILIIGVSLGAELGRKSPYEADGSTRTPFKVTQFLLDIWHYHNQIRYVHGQDPLLLDERLSQNAQEWAEWISETSPVPSAANKTAYMRFTKWAHDTYSESTFYLQYDLDKPEPDDAANLALFSKIDPKNPGWYAQVAERGTPYDFNKPTYTDATHFTLLVWKGVLFLGCGKHYGKNPTFGKNVLAVVCHYMPPGNLPVTTDGLRQYVKPPVPGRHLDQYSRKNLTKEDLYVMGKPKHPIVRFQMVVLKFLRSMKYVRKPLWYDFLL